MHAHLERLASGVEATASLAQVAEGTRALCAAIDPRVIPAGSRPEVAYAFDVRTGRAREITAEGRDYPAGPTEIPGRVDLVIPAGEGRPVVVVDWKTSAFDFDAQGARPQLDFYALCVARVERLDEVECAIGVITDAGGISWHRWTLDFEALARVAAKVREAWQRVELARLDREEYEREHAAPWTPDVVTGAHCRWCHAWEHCPAKRAVLEQDAPITAENAAEAYLRAQDMERRAKAAREAVGELVGRIGPLRTADARLIKRDGRGHLRVARAS